MGVSWGWQWWCWWVLGVGWCPGEREVLRSCVVAVVGGTCHTYQQRRGRLYIVIFFALATITSHGGDERMELHAGCCWRSYNA